MNIDITQKKQPEIFKILSFIQLCKFFSHYGVRSILVLYMIEDLHNSDARAFGINATFCGLIELAAIFGGVLADRYCGLRHSIIIGSVALALGYGSILYKEGFFISLSLIILGGSLFSSNITALLGSAYSENDSRRERGFTLFYMMQNLGALFSTLLCGFISIRYGYRMGFLVASTGMVLALIGLFMKRDLLGQSKEILGRKSRCKFVLFLLLILASGFFIVSFEEFFLPFLPVITVIIFCFFAARLLRSSQLPKVDVYKLLLYLIALILFFAAEDQICSSLIVFAERQTDCAIFGWRLPSSAPMSINPLTIIIGGVYVARRQFSLLTAFVLVAIAFGALALLSILQFSSAFSGILTSVVMISIAELIVGPRVSSIASEIAAKGDSGMVMGMVPIAFSLAFLLGGRFSKMVAIEENIEALTTYGAGFGKVALFTLGGGIILQLLMNRLVNAKRSIY